ncbi:MAG: O-antigen ligase family protein [Eubacterium sp.]|nr:O-antigen ligase family protein [Eubacterium sp.]
MRGFDFEEFGKSNHKRSISSIMLSLIVCLSFVAHLFFCSISATAYLTLLSFFTIVYIISKPVILFDKNIVVVLVVFELSIIFSFLRSQRSSGSLIDVLVLFLGIFIVIFFTCEMEDYSGMMNIILFFSLFFAVGTILNVLLPGIHSAILSFFPSSYSSVVRQQAVNRIPGFSTNPGFSAGYITAGILVVVADTKRYKRINKSHIIPLSVLLFSLLLTGKRGPTIFLILTLFLCYLIPIRGIQKVKRYWRLFLVVLVVFILFFAFNELLVDIPVVSEINRTITGILAGEDVSSGRNRLYAWAIQLFLRHPIFGIGWGDYKTTVVGNATLIKELDTHNIYLQLLCETGIFGFLIAAVSFFLLWNRAKNAYKECIANDNPEIQSMLPFVYFSFAYQTCFLLFGLTGNTLYDQHYQILYMISCAITMTYNYKIYTINRY